MRRRIQKWHVSIRTKPIVNGPVTLILPLILVDKVLLPKLPLLAYALLQFIPKLLDQRGIEASLKRRTQMLWTIFVILLVLWLLGVVSSYTIGGFIHILLVIALVVLLLNIIGGRRTAI